MGSPLLNLFAVALGSNLGDRIRNLCFGAQGLTDAGMHLEAFSSVYETPPIGLVDQPSFLNMVALGRTHLPPGPLLSIFRAVEEEAGRTRGFPNAPRQLDLDLLFFGDRIVRELEVTVPHPRWKERSFVVRPLAEVSPGLLDPETGWQVHEVAKLWPTEPVEIRIVETREGFREALGGYKGH